ncbi:hypothetical protein TK90_2847 (plasmid) [Thioalkalivibrio sp. K90mix]|nr:hypothetical protein TK90_2847 [Thioalkalivibrio sp. K90mix]
MNNLSSIPVPTTLLALLLGAIISIVGIGHGQLILLHIGVAIAGLAVVLAVAREIRETRRQHLEEVIEYMDEEMGDTGNKQGERTQERRND